MARQAVGDQPPCVVIRIESGNIYVVLATSGCPATDRVARDLRPDEQRTFELWNNAV